MNVNSKRIFLMMCAVALSGSVVANETNQNVDGAARGEAILQDESSPLQFDFGLDVDSKFMSYGLVDNNDPIVTPHAAITVFDWLTFEAAAIFDVTKYGKKAGYGNRAGRYTELDGAASLSHTFSSDDYEFLPTSVEFSLGYLYEYHPRSMGGKTDEPGDDSQFITLEIALPDLWFEPKFSIERDIDRDNGTYFNLEVGHEFAIIKGANDDDTVLSFRPSLAQGLGTMRRTRGYGLAEHHGGLMDFCLKGELSYQLSECCTITTYVAYSDYLFDATLRDGARDYEATGRHHNSYNFLAGISVNITF